MSGQLHHTDLGGAGKPPLLLLHGLLGSARNWQTAGRALAAQSPGAPQLPNAPDAHVMACCMKSIKDRKVACVLLSSEGTPITMSVANASDMRSPRGEKVTRGGATYHVVASGAINMISTERGGRWVCLIGETSSDRLIEIAQKLQF